MVCTVKPVLTSMRPRKPSTPWSPISHAWGSGAPRTSFVTRPDEGPYVRWTYRLEPSGTGTRVTEVWDVEQLPPPLQSWTQAQLEERVRYTEDMLTKTLAALKKTAEG